MFRATAAQDHIIAERPWYRTHKRLLGIASLSVAGGVLLAIYFWNTLGTTASIDARRLSIGTVEQGTFERDVPGDAVVIAPDSRTLSAAWTGVVSLHTASGDAVKKGQLLAIIESPDLQSRLLKGRAKKEALEVAAQRSTVESAKAKIVNQEEVATAVLDVNVATRELARKRRAFDVGAYPAADVNRAEDELERAQRRERTARASTELDETRRALEIKGRHLAHRQQELFVNELERQAGLLRIESPVTGQVAQVHVGNSAAVSRDTPILSVVDLTALELEMKIPPSQADDVPLGNQVEISAGSTQYKARIVGVAPEVVGGQVTVRLKFESPPAGLRQGQRLPARIVLDRREGVIMVRRGPFLEDLSGQYIYVIDGNRAIRRKITVGEKSLHSVEIQGGLRPGEEVVISGSSEFGNASEVLIN